MMNVLDISSISWECVHFLSGNPLKEIMENLRSTGVKTYICDTQSLRTEQDLFNIVSHTLKFPEYFGFNWDAMDECLRDLEWLPEASGYVLAMLNSKSLWQNLPFTAGRLVQSWLFAAEEWSREQKSFHLVFLEMEN